MSDAAEAATPRLFLGRQDLLDTRAQSEIGESHDAGDDSTAGPLRFERLLLHELDLTDRSHVLRAVGAVLRRALDEDRLRDVVRRAGVLVEVRHQIRAVGKVPQMVVRVDDLLDGVESVFGRCCEPGGLVHEGKLPNSAHQGRPHVSQSNGSIP